MHQIQRNFFVCVFVLFFAVCSTSAVKAQATPVYLFLETVDSNQKPVVGATVVAPQSNYYQRGSKQTDEKGSAMFEYLMRLPALSEFRISKSGYYPFDLFGLLRSAFSGVEWTAYGYGRKLKVELLRIPQNKAERKILGDEQQKREFFEAVLKGDALTVRKFLKSGIDPNITTDSLRGLPHPNGISAILYAADNSDIETMNEFLAAGIDLRRENSEIRNILAYYVGSSNPLKAVKDVPYNERLDAVSAYLDVLIKAGASLDAVNSEKEPLMTVAAKRGSPLIVKKLIERGAPVNAKNKDGSTALSEMFNFGYNPNLEASRKDIINILLESGADPNITVETKYSCDSPLIYTAKYGQIDFVKLLLSYKADPNLRCTNGNNALNSLRWDFTSKYVEMLDLLLEAGADINAANESGITPLMIAVDSGNISVIKMLLGKGAEINAQDKLGRTALMFALQGINGKPDIEIVELLLKSGANPNLTVNGKSQESFGTALSGAVWHEPLYCIFRDNDLNCWYRDKVQYASEDIIKLLIANKADVNLTFGDKDTPLVSAAKGGRIEAIKILIEAGADVKGEQGQKAIKAAQQKMSYMPDKDKYREVIKFLEAAGAK